MEDKYYIPSIREFHEGFEYEMKSTFGDGTVKTQSDYDKAKWIKQTYSLREFPYVDRTMSGKNSINLPPAIRVKYLDKEDIESLGWKEDKDGWFRKANYQLLTMDFLHVTIYYIKYKQFGIRDDGILFDGNLKNKSELKRIMEQVKIVKQ